MSDKKDYNISPSLSRQLGLPPNTAYGAAPPGVSYAQMTAAAPPSYVESLNHPVVASPPGAPPQYPTQYSPASAAAAASAQQQLQMVSGLWSYQMQQLQMNMAAAQQAQKVAYVQQQAFQQQHPGVYMQQQAYAQQVPGYYPHPAHATQLQPGQNVLVMNGYDGVRFDSLGQPSVSPPSPGMSPSAAQMAAAAQSQKKDSYLGSGPGGQYTFW